jgi:hypothetical protein
MSFWVRAFCHQSLAAVTAKALRLGIAKRLEPLTYLLCPDEEEDPGEVISRMTIDTSMESEFRTFFLRYGPEVPFIRIDRYHPVRAAEVDKEVLLGREGADVDKVRELLVRAKDEVAFDLKPTHLRGMGYPLSVAGAAYLVAEAGGIILSDTSRWLVPEEDEVRIILDIEE